MRDLTTPSTDVNGLVCVWIPVQGPDGRVRMEARWQAEQDTQPAVTNPAA